MKDDEDVFLNNMWRRTRRLSLILAFEYLFVIVALTVMLVLQLPIGRISTTIITALDVWMIIALINNIAAANEHKGLIFGRILIARSGTDVYMAKKPVDENGVWIVSKPIALYPLRFVAFIIPTRGRGETIDDAIRDYLSKV